MITACTFVSRTIIHLKTDRRESHENQNNNHCNYYIVFHAHAEKELRTRDLGKRFQPGVGIGEHDHKVVRSVFVVALADGYYKRQQSF